MSSICYKKKQEMWEFFPRIQNQRLSKFFFNPIFLLKYAQSCPMHAEITPSPNALRFVASFYTKRSNGRTDNLTVSVGSSLKGQDNCNNYKDLLLELTKLRSTRWDYDGLAHEQKPHGGIRRMSSLRSTVGSGSGFHSGFTCRRQRFHFPLQGWAQQATWGEEKTRR